MRTPTAGEVCVDGRSPRELSTRELRALRTRIGFVHQDLALVPNLRVFQNVIAGSLGRRPWGASLRAMIRPRGADLERAHEVLERFGIADKLYQPTEQLSGGERQRVAIARALFQQPRVLFADEPVASVDPARADDVLAQLDAASSEFGFTLVVSLHDIGLARAHLPRLVGLREGRVAFDAPSPELDDERLRELYRLHRED